MPSHPKKQILLKFTAAFGAILMITAAPLSAQAQDSIFTIPAPENESFADVGVAAVTRDTYVGSNESEELILPFVNAEYKGRFFLKPGLGAGIYAIKNKQFRVAVSGNLALGRESDETPFEEVIETQGLDEDLFEIDSTVTANLSVRYYLPFGAIDVLGAIPVGGGLDGQRVDALFTTEVYPVKKLRLTPGVRATYQSSGWVNSIYGVDADQATALNIDEVDLGGQFSTIGAHVIGYYQLPRNLELVGVVNYSRLLGDIQDSPLTETNNGLTAALGIAYQF